MGIWVLGVTKSLISAGESVPNACSGNRKDVRFPGIPRWIWGKTSDRQIQMDFERLAGGSYWSASASTSRHASRSGTRTIMPRMVCVIVVLISRDVDAGQFCLGQHGQQIGDVTDHLSVAHVRGQQREYLIDEAQSLGEVDVFKGLEQRCETLRCRLVRPKSESSFRILE